MSKLWKTKRWQTPDGTEPRTPTTEAFSVLATLNESPAHWGGLGFLGDLRLTGAETAQEIEQAAVSFDDLGLTPNDLTEYAFSALHCAINAIRLDSNGDHASAWASVVDAVYAVTCLHHELYRIYTLDRNYRNHLEIRTESRLHAQHHTTRALKEEMIKKWLRIGESEFEGNKTEFAKAQGLTFKVKTIVNDWLSPTNIASMKSKIEANLGDEL